MNRGQYKVHAEEDEQRPARLAGHETAQRSLVERGVVVAGSPAKLARCLEITPSHVSRLRKGTAGLSVEVALRLADVVGEDGVDALRTCGHGRMVERIDRLRLGAPSFVRSQVYDAIDRLSDADRRMVVGLVHRLLAGAATTTPSHSAEAQAGSQR